MNKSLWKRFVQQFRETADDDGNWRCEFWGKLMRGGSLVYQCSADEALYELLTESVKDMLTTQDAEGRFSTYSKQE